MLRPPGRPDAEAIFERYASDSEVTRYLSFPTHRSLDDTLAFISMSEANWKRWPAAEYLIIDAAAGELLGGTGLQFETAERAETGYVLARDAWGRGIATEALRAMVALAPTVGLRRLQACCHPDHAASQRVLEKGGFACEGLVPSRCELPNLVPGRKIEMLSYVLELEPKEPEQT